MSDLTQPMSDAAAARTTSSSIHVIHGWRDLNRRINSYQNLSQSMNAA